MALVENAQKTLDLQYYAIHADASSERLLLGVVAAARRGVRVRVLLDDFHSTGRDAQVMRLAFVPNIEMRMFNPLTGARGSPVGRMFSLLSDFSRLQQRMHNKLFIADNVLGVTGGRNLGDAYFGNADSGNFVDLDVLAAGPIVQDLSRSFDSYWNNDRAYPVQSLITREDLNLLRERVRAADDAQRSGSRRQGDAQAPPDNPPPAAAPRNPGSRRARIWNQQPMDLARAPFTWAPAAVLVDQPAKIPPDGAAPPSLPEQAAAKASPRTVAAQGPRRAAGGKGSQPAANGAATQDPQTDTVVDGLLQLRAQAQRDVLIVSPYFVPGADMVQAFHGLALQLDRRPGEATRLLRAVAARAQNIATPSEGARLACKLLGEPPHHPPVAH